MYLIDSDLDFESYFSLEPSCDPYSKIVELIFLDVIESEKVGLVGKMCINFKHKHVSHQHKKH